VRVNMRIFTLVLVFSFSFLGGSFAASLAEAQKDYLQGDYESAIVKAKTLRVNPDNLYFIGLAYMKINDYKNARIYFRSLVKNFQYSRLYPWGLVRLADTYFFQKEYDDAFSLYKKINEEYITSDIEPRVLLRLAQLASKKGLWQEKNKYINSIKSKYPHCPEMKFVKILESLGDFFTIQVGAFSERKNALSLADELSQDYYSYIIEDKKGSFPIYKVRVGKYKDRFEAQKVFDALLNKGYPAHIYP